MALPSGFCRPDLWPSRSLWVGNCWKIHFSRSFPEIVLSLHPTRSPSPGVCWSHSQHQRFDWPPRSSCELALTQSAPTQSLCLLSPCRLDPDTCTLCLLASPAGDPTSDPSPLSAGSPFAPCLSGCAERWRSPCGTWWRCWHAYSPPDAVTARMSVLPVVCSCSSSSCSRPSTPWWVYFVCHIDDHLSAPLCLCSHNWTKSWSKCIWDCPYVWCFCEVCAVKN